MRLGLAADADQMRSGCKFFLSPYTNANFQFALRATLKGKHRDIRAVTRIGGILQPFDVRRDAEILLVRHGADPL